MKPKASHPLDPYIEQWKRETDELLQATAVDYRALFGPLPTPTETPENTENERSTQ